MALSSPHGAASDKCRVTGGGACVAALATRELGLDPDIVNVNGGAVALGHPLGNTGTRMIVTLIHELQKRGQEIGLTGACVGGGQGAGSVIKVEG